ncbi:hypothetical protein [Ellagibacter isourolithinifaciens]|uniref:hypothetical protein n=1 Tax=Ellagibacter isourolithinifaciens TaxID=2137581 RepID=UPI003A93B13B
MAARKTKTVEDFEKELADERAKWEEKRKRIEDKINAFKKEQQKKEAEAKAKAAQAIGEEILASLGDWKRVDFDALSLALAEIPGLVPDNGELDASADAAIARVDAYSARVHSKK